MVQEKQPKKCPKIDEYRLDLKKTTRENLTQKPLHPLYSLHLKPARIWSEPLPMSTGPQKANESLITNNYTTMSNSTSIQTTPSYSKQLTVLSSFLSSYWSNLIT